MAATCAQIVSIAQQIAKCPGFSTQAGFLLNQILRELAENYDFDVNKNSSFTLTTTGGASNSGPYALPADYLRAAPNEVNYSIQGTPYILEQVDYSTFLSFYEGPGISNQPFQFATDMSTSPPNAYVWPPANGSYVINWPYFKQHTDITNPQSSSTVPWFPQPVYLYTRLAAELMKITDDTRTREFLNEARLLLDKYLMMKDDGEGYAKTVTLDRQSFRSFSNLKPTKITGW